MDNIEDQFRDWGKLFCHRHEICFGYDGIANSSSDEYLRLRTMLGHTAGYNRHINLQSEYKYNCCSKKSKAIYEQLFTKGWYVIQDNITKDINNFIISDHDKEQKLLLQNHTKRSIKATLDFSSSIKSIINEDVYDAIKLYLMTDKPFFYSPHILISKPNPKDYKMTAKELSDYAFSYHRDYDNIRWLKLFVNLSETTGGEHEYVETSHHTKTRYTAEHYSMRTQDLNFEDQFCPQTLYESHLWCGRMNEKAITDLYTDSVVQFQTNKGFCWLEDTYGLHRGNPPKVGNRALAAYLIGQYPVKYS